MSAKKPTDRNRPLRVFEKILNGGLGRGNLGVVMSSHGTGKLAVMTCVTVDKAMDGKNVLHVALGQSVSDVRAYRDEILNEIGSSIAVEDRADTLTNVERHSQIYTFRNGTFGIPKLAQTVDFLADHAEFRPDLIEIEGWPDWRSVDAEEIRHLKRFAQAASCEIWMALHNLPGDKCDDRGVPDYLARVEDAISVVVRLDPEKDHTRLRFVKVPGGTPPVSAQLEFDPTSMLIRWR
jgi:hypothetical protein